MQNSGMWNGLRGVFAGAAGTIALDLTTYSDMQLRGRPASNVPATVAGKLADLAGIDALSPCKLDERSENRRQAAGALLGYTAGLAIGGLYGLMQGDQPAPRRFLAGAAVGLLAMAASDLPIALTGVSDPREWSAMDWASDLIPHLIYGMVVVTTYDAIGQLRTA